MTVQVKEGTASVPLWAVIVVLISILLAMGGVYYGWANKLSQAELNDVRINIQQLDNEMQETHELDFSQTAAISDIRTDVTDRLARIETTVMEIKERIR